MQQKRVTRQRLGELPYGLLVIHGAVQAPSSKPSSRQVQIHVSHSKSNRKHSAIADQGGATKPFYLFMNLATEKRQMFRREKL